MPTTTDTKNKRTNFALKLLYAAANKPASPAIIASIQKGLPVSDVSVLTEDLGISTLEMAKKLGLSKATFHRRQKTGRLTADESDKMIRYARLFGRAIDTLESEDAARRWLSSPQVGLGGAVPLDYAETETGAREVEDLLGRIEYGVIS
jgi:putative toxin-antitoxin system antitoxin component (TIGR02293 family)